MLIPCRSVALQVSLCCPAAGPIKATDPERAAANRATRRKQILRMACTEGGGLQEDIAAAEAEYEAAQNRCACIDSCRDKLAWDLPMCVHLLQSSQNLPHTDSAL